MCAEQSEVLHHLGNRHSLAFATFMLEGSNLILCVKVCDEHHGKLMTSLLGLRAPVLSLSLPEQQSLFPFP